MIEKKIRILPFSLIACGLMSSIISLLLKGQFSGLLPILLGASLYYIIRKKIVESEKDTKILLISIGVCFIFIAILYAHLRIDLSIDAKLIIYLIETMYLIVVTIGLLRRHILNFLKTKDM